MKQKHIGSSFEDFLKEEGTLKETTNRATKRLELYFRGVLDIVPKWDDIACMTGKELKRKREQMGMSLSKFAKLVGIPKSTLARWEKQKEIRQVVVPAIEKMLK
jgi:DNA-binding transcriptional regulator YiaG